MTDDQGVRRSLCVCDAFGMCPQGCAYCSVCGGTGDQAVPLPAGAITAGLAALHDRLRKANPMQTVLSSTGAEYGLVSAIVSSAAPAIRAQALADAHLVPDTLIDETRRDEREACARLAEQQAATTPRVTGGDRIADAEQHAYRRIADLIRARTTP